MVVAETTTEIENWLSQAATAKDWRDRAALRSSTTPEILFGLKELNHPDIDKLVDRLFNHPFDTFEPRPDRPELLDEQTGYCESTADITVACGGNGCLGAEQTIFDPVAKMFRRVGSIRNPFHVFAISPSGNICVAKASQPWVKGVDDLYRISLTNGDSFVCTLDHRVLSRGRWKEVRGLRVGDPLSASCVPKSSNGDEKPAHITSIEFVRRDVFYDIEVSPHHNYLAAGVWHHNSGKTFVGAQRCNKLLTTDLEPPAKDTPFWIIANTYEMACSSCWKQNLRNIIPVEWIDESRISWYKEKRDWPLAVPLKPWPGTNGRNWVLEFKSYEQGRELMQSTSIGGAWFTEQFPWEVFEEVLRGCRKWMRPGCIWMEFTPIDPAKSVEIQDVYESWTAGDEKYKNWAFYHLSTEEAVNAGHAERSWYEAFFSTVSEEMAETRKRGVFATYEGAIYQSFKPKIHLIDDDDWPRTPPNVWHRRAIDWGASAEHPFCCEWGYRDAIGCWWIYDEYWNDSQSITAIDHIEEIKDRHPWPENSPYHGATYGDPSRPDQMSLFGRFGIPVTPAKNAVYDGIETVRRHLKINEGTAEPTLFINRHRCPKLARQMTTYRWLRSTGKGVNPKAARPEPLKKDDDAADTLRYLLHSEYIASKGAPRAMNVPRPNRPGINHKRNGQVWNG